MRWHPSVRRALTVRQEWVPKPTEASAATAGRAAAARPRTTINAPAIAIAGAAAGAVAGGRAFFHVLAIVSTSLRASASVCERPRGTSLPGRPPDGARTGRRRAVTGRRNDIARRRRPRAGDRTRHSPETLERPPHVVIALPVFVRRC